MFHNPEEWQTLVSKTTPSEKPREKNQLSGQCNQRQCPRVLLSFKVPPLGTSRSHWGVSSRQLSFSPGYFPASVSLLEPTCGICAATGHVASRARSSHEHTSQPFARWVREHFSSFLCQTPSCPAWCVCLPSLGPTSNQVLQGGRRAFPPTQLSSCLTKAQCNTSFCHHFAWERGYTTRSRTFHNGAQRWQGKSFVTWTPTPPTAWGGSWSPQVAPPVPTLLPVVQWGYWYHQ